MWYLYLDESGDLGFDFVSRRPSKYFAISILAVSGIRNNRRLINAVKHTLKRKLGKRMTGNSKVELKGSKTAFEIKKYFYRQCHSLDFSIFSIILNKRRLYASLVREKDRVYNYIARLVMDKIPIERSLSNVELIVDRSKSKPEIEEFNKYIVRMLQGRLDPKVALNILHQSSHQSPGLQAADLFCWGIFRKYEKKDTRWYSLFAKDKIKYETVFLPENKKSAPC